MNTSTAARLPRPYATLTLLVTLCITILLSGCWTSPPQQVTHRPRPVTPLERFERASWDSLPGWGGDNVQEAWAAFLASCKALRFRQEWTTPCAAAGSVSANSAPAIRGYFQQYFLPYRVYDTSGPQRRTTGLITGYYEPLLRGSRTPSVQYVAPLYGPPPDLLTVDLASIFPELKGKRVRGRLEGNRVVPYYSREELPTNPSLRGQEIVWVDSALDALLLEVQGSGRVQLPDGEVIRLQYADQNGQPYRSIGRYLVTQGQLTTEQATMPGIRAWLRAHPQRLREVLNANPSVVFFTAAPLGDPMLGPKGAQGIPLTAGRSIAVDPQFVPLGTPVFLDTTFPASDRPLQRLVIAQDTGGAIVGAPRADLFWGGTAQAADLAGQMRQQGAMWLLWPKDAPAPRM